MVQAKAGQVIEVSSDVVSDLKPTQSLGYISEATSPRRRADLVGRNCGGVTTPKYTDESVD